MNKLFFDHLVRVDRVREKLASLAVAEEEVKELEGIIDGLVQQRVVETVLDVLDEEHHHVFISRVHLSPSDPEILVWLKEKVEDIEEKISIAIGELEEELLLELSRGGSFSPPSRNPRVF